MGLRLLRMRDLLCYVGLLFYFIFCEVLGQEEVSKGDFADLIAVRNT